MQKAQRYKIPDTRVLFTKTDYDAKSKETVNKTTNHDKCVTTAEFNKFYIETFDATLRQANLIPKNVLNGKIA